MRSKIIPTLVCAVLLLGAAATTARASTNSAPPITVEIVKQKIELCRTGDERQQAEAFDYLYVSRERVLPILHEIRKSGTEQERDWADTIKDRIDNKHFRHLENKVMVLEQESEKNSQVIKNLTNYELKDTHFYTAVALSIILFGVIIDLVRRKLLRIEYSWVWMLTGTAVLVLISTGLLQMISLLIGARVPQTLFFAGVSFLTMIALHYSVAISKLTNQVKNLSQELAVLKHEAEELTKPNDTNKQE